MLARILKSSVSWLLTPVSAKDLLLYGGAACVLLFMFTMASLFHGLVGWVLLALAYLSVPITAVIVWRVGEHWTKRDAPAAAVGSAESEGQSVHRLNSPFERLRNIGYPELRQLSSLKEKREAVSAAEAAIGTPAKVFKWVAAILVWGSLPAVLIPLVVYLSNVRPLWPRQEVFLVAFTAAVLSALLLAALTCATFQLLFRSSMRRSLSILCRDICPLCGCSLKERWWCLATEEWVCPECGEDLRIGSAHPRDSRK